MLADFYIPRLSNDMKIAVQKTYLGGQILYRSLVPSKKRRQANLIGRNLFLEFTLVAKPDFVTQKKEIMSKPPFRDFNKISKDLGNIEFQINEKMEKVIKKISLLPVTMERIGSAGQMVSCKRQKRQKVLKFN